ncbi:MAG TPA: outer membrane beta-barrel protein [Geminicoccaceae bacterium]|nr:outer membrane beta-barrel protein [Geminicoccaceae bacterium]
MPRHLARLLLLPLGFGLAAVPAGAQEPEPSPNVPVQERPRPDYDPLGIRAGAFLIFPALRVEGAYDDNVFATSDDEVDDWLAVVAPRITARSQWSRHALAADLGGSFGFYKDTDENNFQDFDGGLNGRLDITRMNSLSAGLRAGRRHEPRDAPDAEALDEEDDVTEFYFANFTPSYRHNFNRVFTVVRGDLQRTDFQDNGDVDNDDRDRWRYGGGLRIGYALSPRFNLFTQGDYRFVRYDRTGAVNRDNEGYTLRVGSEVDITGLIFGELSLGYTSVDYEDPDLEEANGLSADGQITWNITPLTTLIFSAAAEVEETTVGEDADVASGNLQYRAGVDATHELLRNLLVNVGAGYVRDDFQGIPRTDNSFRLGAGLSYLINRNFAVTAGYTYSMRDSDEDDAEYTRNLFRVGITARM